jgi:hypothetical protein
MASSLTPDATSEIRRALMKLPQHSHYIKRLGMPQAIEKIGVKGTPVFNGKGAESCKALYLSLMDNAKPLQARFDTKEDLREADARKHADLMALFAEPLLVDYGHDVWGPAEPYSTRISPEYEQFLKCDDAEDCAR